MSYTTGRKRLLRSWWVLLGISVASKNEQCYSYLLYLLCLMLVLVFAHINERIMHRAVAYLTLNMEQSRLTVLVLAAAFDR